MNIPPPQANNNSAMFSHAGELMRSRQVLDSDNSETGLSDAGLGSAADDVNKESHDDSGEKKKRRKKKWKKPKDKPNRPLSAYNLFFQSQRALMLGDDAPTDEDERLKKRVHCKTHGKIGFAEMARKIASKWKSLEAEEKKSFEEQADREKKRYAVELAAWKESQKVKNDTEGSQSVNAQMSSPVSDGRAVLPPGFLSNQVLGRQGSDAMDLLLADQQQQQQQQRNISLLQQLSYQDLDYLRALQQRAQIDQATLFNHQQPQPFLEYPSAAEASANALMQQFQQRQPTRALLEPAAAAQSLDQLQYMARHNANMAAARRRLQNLYRGNDS